MADEANTSRPTTSIDLNLYLGPPRSSRPLTLDLGSDLSLSSLPPPSSSNSGESRVSVAMEAFITETDLQFDVAHPICPCFDFYEPYLRTVEVNARGLQIEQIAVDPEVRDLQRCLDSVHGLPSHSSADLHDENLLLNPEFRIRRLMNLYDGEEMNLGLNLLSSSNRFTLEPLISQPKGKQKAPADSVVSKNSEDGGDKKNRCSTNFNCNVCLDISKEPVVTSCGHLFCWPCLYQWLHIHSQYKECPVCKGEVTEANIIPIYGRASSDIVIECKDEESKGLGHSIPPRPGGHRAESWRQQFDLNLQINDEGIGNPRSRLLNYRMSVGGRHAELHDAFLQEELLIREPPAILSRSRVRRGGRAHEIGPSTGERRVLSNDELIQRIGGAVSVPDEFEFDMTVGRRSGGSFTENTGRRGISRPVNFPALGFYSMSDGRRVADQASVSSTVAMISGESSVRDVSTEPNCAGSSRPPRTRRGSCAASSSDDGGDLHSCKRTRLH